MSSRRRPALLLATVLCLAPQPTVAQQGQPRDAAGALRELAAACEVVGDGVWGVQLCGRTVLVEPATRRAFASHAPPGGEFSLAAGVYEGVLPASVPLANTAVEWGGARWAMALLPLPAERYDRLRILAHESFHRLQPELGLGGRDEIAGHLDELDSRLWLRLELRALARAVEEGAADGKVATHHASLFRAQRYRARPGAAASESALERQEGLAEYAGVRFAMAATGEGNQRLADALARFEERRSFGRSFAYVTGPALGILLDRYAPGWRARLAGGAEMVDLLVSAIGRTGGDPDEAVARAAEYGYAEVLADETRREAERARVRREYRERLITGPRIVLRQEQLNRSFDPNSLIMLGAEGVVHPSGTFFGPWGRLTVERGGALLAPDLFSWVAVPVTPPLTDDTAPLRGDGWTLELEHGWILVPGERPGDYEVERAPSADQ